MALQLLIFPRNGWQWSTHSLYLCANNNNSGSPLFSSDLFSLHLFGWHSVAHFRRHYPNCNTKMYLSRMLNGALFACAMCIAGCVDSINTSVIQDSLPYRAKWNKSQPKWTRWRSGPWNIFQWLRRFWIHFTKGFFHLFDEWKREFRAKKRNK